MSRGEEDLFCGICNRDYELPRRHCLFAGDHDFAPIPRLLPCLHTICHSCIEEQYEKDDAHIVCCSVCKHEEPIKAVDFLPLDFSILKKVVQSNNTELLAWCAKCYDPVSSVSWCESCSSALCEFHHQDHKLSADTSRHNVATFKEYLEMGRHIEYKFPPISCPQCILQDCSLYCNSCLHLISPKAFIDFHKEHRVTDYVEIIPDMITAVGDAVEISDSNHMAVGSKVMEIRQRLQALDENETLNTDIITSTFDRLREELKVRETEMLNNLARTINTNRTKLKEYMQELIILDSKIQRVTNCGRALLQDTSGTDNIEKMYLVAAADSIEYRADFLNDKLTNLMSHVDSLRDPVCDVKFIKDDLQIIEGIIDRLGSIETGLEDKPPLLFAPEKREGDDSGFQDYLTEDEKQMAEDFDIFFTVKLRDQPPSRASAARGKVPRSASVMHGIVIEARLRRRPKREAVDESLPSPRPVSSRGVLLGEIEVLERVDREILAKHKIKSYFETVKQSNNNSVLKVMKEFVPLSR